MGRRFDERYSAQLPVRIWGMDTFGRPFSSNTKTVDITHSGARIGGIDFSVNKGDVVGIQCGNDKARFKVIWVGVVGGPRESQIGVHCAESGKFIWGVKLPLRTWDIDPHPIPGHGQMVPLAGTLELPKVPDKPKVHEPENKHAARRVHKRVACSGPLTVKPESGSPPLHAIMNDISVSGCYAETPSPLPVHSRVHFTMELEGQEIHGSGIVRTCHHGVGMGISFTTLSLHDRDNLSMIVARLAQQTQHAKPAHLARAVAHAKGENTAPRPEATTMPVAGPAGRAASGAQTNFIAANPPQPMPAAPTLRRPGTASAATASSMPSPSSAPRGAAMSESRGVAASDDAASESIVELSDRIQRISQEVAQLQNALISNRIDNRMVQSFRVSMDHARQMAWAIEQWLHLESQNRDPFEALSELDAENIRRAIQLGKDIAVTIDATEIGTHTPGIEELYLVTDELRSRLGRLLKKEGLKDKPLRSPMRSPDGTPMG